MHDFCSVPYINTEGCQATAFLNMRHIDICGATAANLFRLWNEAACDYDLDVSKHVAIACEWNSCYDRLLQFSQKLMEQCLALHSALLCA